MPPITARAPFHQQADDLRDFTTFYDERERLEREHRRVGVTGPSENSD